MQAPMSETVETFLATGGDDEKSAECCHGDDNVRNVNVNVDNARSHVDSEQRVVGLRN